MRLLVISLVLLAAAGFGWIFTLPNAEECIASGRTPDPTQRYCMSANGEQLLEEHALFHSREVVIGTLLLVGIGMGISNTGAGA